MTNEWVPLTAVAYMLNKTRLSEHATTNDYHVGIVLNVATGKCKLLNHSGRKLSLNEFEEMLKMP